MIKVWGRNNSVNVQKATWCLEELKVPYERIDAGMQYGVVNTPEFRKMNPNGLVPVIEDGGTVLWESNAIVRYLAAKYGKGTLWPEDPAGRAHQGRRSPGHARLGARRSRLHRRQPAHHWRY